MKTNVNILKEQINGFNVIELSDGSFKGCQLIFGGLSFDEEDEGLLHFDYEITNGYVVEKENMEQFVNTVGDVLTNLIEDALNHANAVYINGVDTAT